MKLPAPALEEFTSSQEAYGNHARKLDNWKYTQMFASVNS